MPDDPHTFIDKWEPQLRKGVLEFVVLLCLRKREYYGYQLIRSVRDLTSLTITEGTIYPLLNRLDDEGLIAPRWVEDESDKPRKYYHLTDRGRAVLTEMEDVWTDLNAALLKLMFSK
jgi:PadR family transcriptional regulator PadR